MKKHPRKTKEATAVDNAIDSIQAVIADLHNLLEDEAREVGERLVLAIAHANWDESIETCAGIETINEGDIALGLVTYLCAQHNLDLPCEYRAIAEAHASGEEPFAR